MTQRITLYADEGRILTDGEHFGKVVTLSAGGDPSRWYEVSEEEYRERVAKIET